MYAVQTKAISLSAHKELSLNYKLYSSLKLHLFSAMSHFLQVMKEHGVYNMVFSSSCVVYGNPQYLPIDEAHPAGNVTNVYGRTKYAVEQMLMDICRAEKVSDFEVYFSS